MFVEAHFFGRFLDNIVRFYAHWTYLHCHAMEKLKLKYPQAYLQVGLGVFWEPTSRREQYLTSLVLLRSEQIRHCSTGKSLRLRIAYRAATCPVRCKCNIAEVLDYNIGVYPPVSIMCPPRSTL